MDYGEKNILVLGAGSSGIGAAWVLAQLHANVVLNDYKSVWETVQFFLKKSFEKTEQ